MTDLGLMYGSYHHYFHAAKLVISREMTKKNMFYNMFLLLMGYFRTLFIAILSLLRQH